MRSLAKLILLAFIASSTQWAKASGFFLEGVLTGRTFGNGGTVKTSSEVRYTLAWDEGRWLYREEHPAKGTDFITSGFDGRDYFNLQRMNADVILEPAKMSGGKSSNRQNLPYYAIAYPGAFPIKATIHESLLWLGYCSAPFLETNASKQMQFPGLSDGRISYEADEPDYQALGPRRVSFRFKGTEENPGHWKRYPAGSLLGEFSVLGFTNVFGKNVPLDFEFRVFRFGNRDTHQVLTLISNHVTLIHPLSNGFQFIPKVPQAAHMLDFRFPEKVGGSLYFIMEKGEWLDRNDPKLDAKLNKLIAPRRSDAQLSILGLIALTILILIPLVFITHTKLKNKRPIL